MNSVKAISKNKHKIVRRALCIVLTLFVIFSVVTVWGNVTLSVEKLNFKTDKINIETDYKIAHISDYHNTNNTFLNNAVLSSLEYEKPDAIVLTGDLIDSRKINIEKGIDFVSGLVEFAPVYYVTGNHECNVSIKNQSAFDKMLFDLEELGVCILRNESDVIFLPNGEKINIYGINDPYFHCKNQSEIESTTDSLCSSFMVDKTEFNILLAHHPEQLDVYSKYNFDLVFSGHAHGGQVRFFSLPLIAPDQGLFPEYTDGEYKSGDVTLIVSRGIGNSIIPLRVFCRPHLVYLNIKNNSLN